MKTFGSYAVEFNGCNHLHHFDYSIGYHVTSDNEIIVHCWYHEGSDMVEGEFIIKGLKNSFNDQSDYTDLVQFLINQYSLYA